MDARFITNDTINGRSLDTYVVTHQGLYLALIRHSLDTGENELVDILDSKTIQNIFNITSSAQYDSFVAAMYACVSYSVMKKR